MQRKFQKGFTLIEMVVVTVVIAILANWAVLTYSRFIERTRAAEAENTIGLVANAQGRQLMRRGHYAKLWASLDAQPLAAYFRQVGNYLSEDGTIYLTGGGGLENPKPGFKMYFEEVSGKTFIVAERINWHYGYTFVRPLPSEKTYCLPTTDKSADIDFCMEFMNVDSQEELPGDPRLASY